MYLFLFFFRPFMLIMHKCGRQYVKGIFLINAVAYILFTYYWMNGMASTLPFSSGPSLPAAALWLRIHSSTMTSDSGSSRWVLALCATLLLPTCAAETHLDIEKNAMFL